ncbi:glycosyltransferase [Mycobacterium phage Squirty]|uniref:Glycosyltransferase n=1 Tax=Mycobacterium phage Squirty TaxID=1527512 RepID=A0A088FBT9_9CAUD|nr:glucosyltransferase [Mycobacterium phage Squirty]AIM41049.1 glycosyltransferase [Mycobacterium phage Squirty]
MTHTIGIVAHTKRAEQAHRLMETVGAAYMSIDNGTLGCETNHRKVWQHLTRHNTDWLTVLEDDAIPCNNFRDQLDAALAVAPSPVVSLYLGRERPREYQQRIAKAADTTAHWLTCRRLLHAVGIAIHAALVPNMLNQLPNGKPIDEAISAWARHQSHTIAYTWPSLVDHADTPSLTGRRGPAPGRVAWRHGDRDQWTNETHPL